MRYQKKPRLPLVFLLLVLVFLSGCSPAFSAFWYQTMDNKVRLGSVVLTSPRVVTGEKAEWAINVQGFQGNPFDSRQIKLDVALESPEGNHFTMPAFWYQDYQSTVQNGQTKLLQTGKPGWRFRFSPASTGTWKYQTILTLGSQVIGIRSGTFQVEPGSPQLSVIHVDPQSKSRFVFTNGSPYIPIGENNGWWRSDHGLGSGIYQTWYDQLAEQGANYSRVWMADWSFGLIWKDSGLWDFTKRMDRAYQLDRLFDLANQDGIYLQLVLFHHGQFSKTVNPEWDKNPFNSVNGGPLQEPNDFFTNPEAKAVVKNYLRYMVARYGYSSNLFCWELFNEVNSVTNYNAKDAAEWHKEMADYLHQLDPYRHMVSTSSTKSDDPINGLPQLDFSNIHYYKEIANLPDEIAKMQQNLLQKYKKPVLVSEIGLNGSSDKTQQLDPGGIYFHQALWSGLYTGGAGSAMSWFWDNYIEDNQFYTQFGPLVKMTQQIPWADPSLAPWKSGNPMRDAEQGFKGYGYQTKTGIFLWMTDTAYSYNQPAPRQMENTSLHGTGLQPGHYTGQIVDPYRGESNPLTLEVKVDGSYDLQLPIWSRDVAIVLKR